MAARSKGTVLTYGIDAPADVSASNIAFAGFGKTRFDLKTPEGRAQVDFPLNGRHNILNALAAASVGHAFGMSAEHIAESLSSVAAPPQRGEVIEFAQGFTVINDSYNSNPDALLSMVNTLVDGTQPEQRKIVVAGEMLELGDDASAIHRHTGLAIASMDVDILIGVRGLAKDLVEGAFNAGFEDVYFADSSDDAGDMLADMVVSGDVVLVKGSRGVKTEKVIEKLLEKFGSEGKQAAAE